MKKLFIILLVSYITVKKVTAQTDSIYQKVASLNLDYYAMLPVDSLLRAIPKSYTSIDLIGYTRNHRIHGLSIYYPNGTWIWITPRNYIYMNPIDPNRIWNINQFKLEKAHYILVTSDSGSLCGSE